MLKKMVLALFVWCLLICQPLQASAMSLNVQDGEVDELLRSVARMAGLNLILDESVKGKVSLKLEDENPANIVEQVAKARGLAITKQGNTWIVAAPDNLTKGFATVHIIPVHYAPLEDMRQAAILYFASQEKAKPQSVKAKDNKENKSSEATGNATQKIKAENRVLTDVSTGSLLVYGTAEDAETVESMVQKLDVPAQQISIETKVVSMSREDASKLGIQWQWSSLPQYNYNSDGVSRPALGTTGTAGGIVSFGKGPAGHAYEWQYGATIDAMIANGKAEVLSRPNVVTLQGQEAVINIGGDVPVPTVSTTNSTVTTSIEYRPAGIILRCCPMVNEAGQITSRIHTEVSSPQYVEEMKAYSFQRRSVDTTVRLQDGETLIIGGLISSEEIRSLSKLPFLGDLPILGQLFRSVHTSKTTSEVFIMLRAEILNK
ncbi:MAG: type II secretion system protein GspD [Anaerovibrio sp.]